MTRPEAFAYLRLRMDALHDGIFAVAMTLLVLDIRLPDDFKPANSADLAAGLIGLSAKLWPYVLSFYVLGTRWLAGVRLKGRGEEVNSAYLRWWLLYLLAITFVPFSTIVVGRYASLAPAVWLYSGTSALIAVCSWRLLGLTPELEDEEHRFRRKVSIGFLLASALTCSVWAAFASNYAMLGMLLNLFAPAVVRWHAKRRQRLAADA
jgi:uncharacterized membrane protein